MNPTTNRGGTHVLQKLCRSCSTSRTRRVKFKTKIQQHEPHQKPWWNSFAPEGSPVPALIVSPLCSRKKIIKTYQQLLLKFVFI